MSVVEVPKSFTEGSDDKKIMKEFHAMGIEPEIESVNGGDLDTGVNRRGFFGEAAQAGGKQYRVLGRYKTLMVFIHVEIGLGILSLASVCKVLGLIPGLISMLFIGILATYTPWIYLQYWKTAPHIDNIADLMKVLGGQPLYVLGAIGWMINVTFTCASASLTMSVAFNTLSGHSMCTVGFVGIAVAACFVLTIPRTMNFVAWVSGPAVVGIIVPLFVVIISLAVDIPQQALPGWHKEMHWFGNPTFREGLSSFMSIVYSFGGRQTLITIMAEMRDPSKDFMPAMYMLQSFGVPLYIVAGTAIYGLAGQYTTSPALGSAPLIPAKAAYGIVLVTLFNSGMLYGHAGIKFLYVTVLRDWLKIPEQGTMNTVKTWSIWIGLGTTFWIVCFIIANAIPSFNSIIGVASALISTWFSYGIPAACWLQLNWKNQFRDWKMTVKSLLHWLLFACSAFLCVAGMWASVMSLIKLFNDPTSTVHGPFTCADTSLF